MREPIEVNYVPDGDDWRITVSGREQTVTGRAPGLVAARDRADELVAELVPEEEHHTVVHLLNGDALAFTSAYLSARLSVPAEVPAGEPAEEPTDEADQQKADDPADPPAGTAPAPRQEPDSESARRASTS